MGITSSALGATLSGIAKASAAAAQGGVPNADAFWAAVAEAIITAVQTGLVVTVPPLTGTGVTVSWTGPGTATTVTPPMPISALTGGVIIV